MGWAKPALQAGSALPKKDVDIILATGSPFLAFRLARRLADGFGCPYVLDYRDPWTGNPHASRPDRLSTIREERELLSGAAAVTIVSPSWAQAMERRFDIGTKLHVLTNGYDPEEVADVKPKDYGHFSIIYTGLFYPPKRVISPMMAALSRLKSTLNEADVKWFFHYYGKEGDHVLEESRKFNVTEHVVIHGRVSRSEVLAALRGADVAVVISSVVEEKSLEDHGVVPGKLFETLGLGTPVLLIAPPDSDAAQMISESDVHVSFSGTDVEGMVRWLGKRIRERSRGNISDPPPELAWPHLAKHLDSLLREHLPNRRICPDA
jgi:glycosyltransferase involved in cell wall biosynthesis